jgi:hypothetical protein
MVASDQSNSESLPGIAREDGRKRPYDPATHRLRKKDSMQR